MAEENEIQEAQVISETTKESPAAANNEDLLARLNRQTEKKTPGAAKKQQPVNDFYAGEDDFKETKTETTKAPAADTKTEAAKTTGPIDDKAKEASARSIVGILDVMQRGIYTPIVTAKFKKKFTDKEKEKLDDLLDFEVEQLADPEDRRIKSKFDRLIEKRDKKIGLIPFTDPEQDEMVSALKNYMTYKGSTILDPVWHVVIAIANNMGKRGVDIFIED